MPTILPPKKDVALALLERASVFIHLDPRDPSVQVPSWFKRQPQLVLQVGLNMLVRIPDLEVGDEALACTLSFNRAPYYCYVPWRAVYALVGEDGRGMVWPEDIPPEVPAQTQPLSQRPRLHSVPRDEGSAPELDAQERDVVRLGTAAAPDPARASAGSSKRGRFRAAGEHDAAHAPSSHAPSSRGQSLRPPALGDAVLGDAARGDAARDAGGLEGPPVLSLSGSKRRRANAAGARHSEETHGHGAEGLEAPPSYPSSNAGKSSSAASSSAASKPAGSSRVAGSGKPADSAQSGDSHRAPALEAPVSSASASSAPASSGSAASGPASSAQSQERSSRSSERPYLRLVR